MGNYFQRADAAQYATTQGAYAVVDTAAYDAYGNMLADIFANTGDPATSREESICFGGQNGYFTDSDTAAGLVCLGHRYYDPGTGRFINRDPIGYEGGENLYAFCGGNPVNLIDPEGTDWVDATSNFCAGAGDVISFGATARIRQWLGVDDIVDRQSGAYVSGEVTGVGISVIDAGTGAVGAAAAIRAAGGLRAVANGIRIASSAGGIVGAARVVRTVESGESLADLIEALKAMTQTDGLEHAVVVTAKGQRIIVSGGEAGIDFAKGSIRTIIAHTHPYHLPPGLGPSDADFEALSQLAQKSGSYLLERGRLFKFWANGSSEEITGARLNAILGK
jgi:RHS repeat-associated protein